MNNKKLIKRIYNVVIILLLIGAITYVVTRLLPIRQTQNIQTTHRCNAT